MNHWDSPTYMISVEDSSSLRGVTVKKKRKLKDFIDLTSTRWVQLKGWYLMLLHDAGGCRRVAVQPHRRMTVPSHSLR